MTEEQRFAQCYRDSNGEWRFRIKHRNGNVLADSGEGYLRHVDMIDTLFGLHPGIEIEYLEEAGP